MKLQLGVDVLEGSVVCPLCASAMDTKGIHCLSCTVGGDLIARHNDIRDLLFSFAERGLLNPLLERAGLLQEPGLFMQLRRPADVLADALPSAASGRLVKVALDVKVINAMGADHINHCMGSATAAMEEYRERAVERDASRPWPRLPGRGAKEGAIAHQRHSGKRRANRREQKPGKFWQTA